MSKPEKCPNCEVLEGRIAELEGIVKEQAKLIEKLEKRIAELESDNRRGKRQAQPFSKGKSALDKRKPGRRKGQGKFSQREQPQNVDETIIQGLESCPDCGGELADKQTHQNWQTDIPTIQPVITHFITHSGFCSQCEERKRCVAPGQIVTASGSAAAGIGPKLKSLAAQLKHQLGVPYAKISTLFSSAFGLKVTPSGLCQANQVLSHRIEPLYAEIMELLQNSHHVHVDETGWRIGALSSWLWVFTNAEMTLYQIDESRGHQVVLGVLGEDYQGILCSDRLNSYNHKNLSHWLKQKCLAHILKNLSELEAKKQRGAIRFAQSVKKLLQKSLKLKGEKSQLKPKVYRSRCQRLEKALDKLLDEKRQLSDADNIRMSKGLRKHRDSLLRFLYDDDLEATNNRAERGLRPAVIARKTGRCNKTNQGAKTHAVLASVIQTASQQNMDVLTFLQQALLRKSLSFNIKPNPP